MIAERPDRTEHRGDAATPTSTSRSLGSPVEEAEATRIVAALKERM
jgi:hypothetical protein